MQIVWNDNEPIYRQLRSKLIEMILEGVISEGEALPSIREISSEHRINHITVAKSMQMLVEEGLVEKRRGVGMFVREGAKGKLITLEKEKFLNEEWPKICKRVKRLGLSGEELLKTLQRTEEEGS